MLSLLVEMSVTDLQKCANNTISFRFHWKFEMTLRMKSGLDNVTPVAGVTLGKITLVDGMSLNEKMKKFQSADLFE